MFEILVFVAGIIVGAVFTHFGYQTVLADAKAKMIQIENEFKSFLATPK